MNKDELAEIVATDANISRSAALAALDSLRDHVTAALVAGEELRIPGLGTFDAVTRPVTVGRNLRTGEALAVPAMMRARFRAAAALKRRLAALAPADGRLAEIDRAAAARSPAI